MKLLFHSEDDYLHLMVRLEHKQMFLPTGNLPLAFHTELGRVQPYLTLMVMVLLTY